MSMTSLLVEILTINLNTLFHHIFYVGIYLIMTNLYFNKLSFRKFLHIIPAIILAILILGGIFAVFMPKKYSMLYIAPCLFIVTVTVIKLYEKLQYHNQCKDSLFRLDIRIKEKQIMLTGFLDTGNMLTDIYTGYPVIILDYRIFKYILSDCEYQAIEKYHKTGVFDYEKAGNYTHFYPLPYKTISSEISLMPALRINCLSFTDYDYSTKKVIAGVSRYKLNNYKDYQVLLNERIKPNREEKFK